MRTRAILRRVDAHLERSNELMAEIRELMAEIRAEMGSTREEIRLSREQIRLSREEIRLSREETGLSREEIRLSRESRDDLRSFIREMVVRMERGAREQAAELRDLREESRAQRQALLRMIDRMGPGGAEAPG